MKSFRRVALAATIAVYVVIFVGGLVRVSGAGLGCPDWPKCFDRWIPPTNVSQLPAGIDPAEFNFTLAWIEYFNRLVGVTVGFLILAAAVLATKHYRKVPRVLYPSLAALVLVAYQGWQGGQVVSSRLEPLFVSVHMLLAIIIASLMIYATQQAYYLAHPTAESGATYPRRIGFWMWLLWLVGLVQIVLGTQVRSAIDMLRRDFPVLTNSLVADSVGPVNYSHAGLGLVIAVLTWYAGAAILRRSKNPSATVKGGVLGIMVLVLAQIAIGIVMIIASLPSLAQLFHLWAAALYIGLLFMLSWALRRQKGETHAV